MLLIVAAFTWRDRQRNPKKHKRSTRSLVPGDSEIHELRRELVSKAEAVAKAVF
ncbi:hypothetical protein G3O06_05390 [Burkholderia sp. Ac-20345]|uniref:hypothetical protein n=1 Tax=Burkholderia sp. Ac-20345 TaxID=2703891 RepID=UPI00197B1B88|nr:hypothetical protein [Burkholderia sp. Ac-20345]MBN3777003.1 hypothetical protein [Burkholderia sp. Ac-20345]